VHPLIKLEIFVLLDDASFLEGQIDFGNKYSPSIWHEILSDIRVTQLQRDHSPENIMYFSRRHALTSVSLDQ
jgi:hypothetical protein